MLILNATDLRRALPMRDTIQAMKRAYAALSNGQAHVPIRTSLPLPSQNATALFMPAYVPDEQGDSGGAALALKIVTLFPKNVSAGLPFIHGAVLVMDTTTGEMLALLEGGALTAIRTGAGGGAATELLARADSRTVALFGAGVQAQTQLEAICTVRNIKTVWVYAPSADRISAFISKMQDKVSATLLPASTPHQALTQADIVCTATTSSTPVFNDIDVQPGTHINGVGSYTSAMIEIPPETVARARVVVDSRAACQAEAGELIRAAELGLFDWQTAVELGEIILDTQPGRSSPEQITFFKSVGVAVQDAVAAKLALDNAQKMGLGQKIAW